MEALFGPSWWATFRPILASVGATWKFTRATQLLATLLLAATPLAAGAADAPALSGEWTVDLSVKPGEPYTRPMSLSLAPDGTVAGVFYGSTIEKGRWKTDRGRTCASFRTQGGAVVYHSAVCQSGDMVQGQTWAEQRDFLFNWNAVRAK